MIEKDKTFEKPGSIEPTADKNYRMLTTDMQQLLVRESFGVNAGSATIDGQKYVAAGANAFFNPLTGEITGFGNGSYEQAGAGPNDSRAIFRVAYDIKNQREKIVDFLPEDDSISTHAKHNIQEAVNKYNQQRWPEVDSLAS